MLADNLEARARADMPKDDAAISDLVHKSIEYCEKEGQLDGTNITIRNLQQIIKSFEHTLKNIYHPRIQYPEIDANQESPMRIHIDLPLHYRMWISIRECRNVAREALEASQDDNPEISLVFTNNRKIRK